MSDPSLDLALRWLQKANNDLVTARQTLLLPDGPTDTVGFHTQQATEKALKALLTFKRITFPKTHDLLRLLDAAGSHLPRLDAYREAFAEMSNYSVQFRYPDEVAEPDRHDVMRSLKAAEEVVALIRSAVRPLAASPELARQDD